MYSEQSSSTSMPNAPCLLVLNAAWEALSGCDSTVSVVLPCMTHLLENDSNLQSPQQSATELSKLATSTNYQLQGTKLANVVCAQAQHGVLQQMRAGELDIVISTAVAEEGLDVKQCQLVIRFDLPSTLLAFVQSRSAHLLLSSTPSFFLPPPSSSCLAET